MTQDDKWIPIPPVLFGWGITLSHQIHLGCIVGTGGGLGVSQNDESNTQDETLPHVAQQGDQQDDQWPSQTKVGIHQLSVHR